MKINPKIIIGLGNPGENYQNTYHNVGFLAIDYFVKNPPISNSKFLISKQIQKFQIPNSKTFKYIKIDSLIFIKPLTFMNESGKAVKAALQRFRIKPAETLIVHDDSDIEIGKYKFSFGRGGAGHKGVESIINALKTKGFSRLRIGIRPAANRKSQIAKGKIKAGELVLKQISKSDMGILQNTFKNASINMR